MQRPALLFLLCLATAVTVAASPMRGQGYSQTREGFWFNGGLGWGSLGCVDCDGRTSAVTGVLAVGETLSSTFLLGAGATGWTKTEGGATLTVGLLDFRFRVYPVVAGGFFLTGGLGIGSIRAALSGVGSNSETGLGYALGLGYDVRAGKMLSLTPFVQWLSIKTENADANVSQIGLSVTTH